MIYKQLVVQSDIPLYSSRIYPKQEIFSIYKQILDKCQNKQSFIEIINDENIISDINIENVVGYITNVELVYSDNIYKIYVYYKFTKLFNWLNNIKNKQIILFILCNLILKYKDVVAENSKFVKFIINSSCVDNIPV